MIRLSSSPWVLLASLCALIAFSCDDGGGGDEADGGAAGGSGGASGAQWAVVQQDLPGALLSIWMSGPDDVWVTGADPGDGQGPMVMHLTGGGPQRLNSGVTGLNLWWVFSRNNGTVWFVGEQGTILKHDVASGQFTPIPSPTTATLYGMWGPPGGGALYAVGGFIPMGSDAEVAVVLRIENDTAQIVAEVPPSTVPKEVYFKVWGTSANDIWVIGDWGSIIHFDGQSWTPERKSGSRLITVHGASADDVVIVGGGGNGEILHRTAGGWSDNLAPADTAGLNGVFVSPSGYATAAGFGGVVLERRGGTWAAAPWPPVLQDWHATWIDSAGYAWVVGGNLTSAATLDQGAVLKYGPVP